MAPSADILADHRRERKTVVTGRLRCAGTRNTISRSCVTSFPLAPNGKYEYGIHRFDVSIQSHIAAATPSDDELPKIFRNPPSDARIVVKDVNRFDNFNYALGGTSYDMLD
jgi:hypothetical protein